MFHRIAILTFVSAVALAACGGDGDDDAAPAAPSATEAPSVTTAYDRGGYGAPAEPIAPPSDGESLTSASTDLGDVITGGGGFTLYIFMPDNAGAPTCLGDCAGAWPPATVDGDPTVGGDADAAMVGTVANPEGGTQLTYNGWPLYFFSGDSAAGDTNGQGQGGVWFAIGVDGEPIQ